MFGVAYLSAFVAAPVFGKLVSTRPKVIYYSGAFIQATLEAFFCSLGKVWLVKDLKKYILQKLKQILVRKPNKLS